MHSLKCAKTITAMRRVVLTSKTSLKKCTTVGTDLIHDKTKRYKSTNSNSGDKFKALIPEHDNFAQRHIGPTIQEQQDMLNYLGVKVSVPYELSLDLGIWIVGSVTQNNDNDLT